MRKLQLLMFSVCLAASMNLALAADKKAEKRKGPALTEEQKKVRHEIMEKYDANKDGKLSRDERNKMTDADREKLKKASPAQGKKKAKTTEKNAHHAGGATNAQSGSAPVKTQ